MCAKTKLHTVNDVCKNYNHRNKIAHTPSSVQKKIAHNTCSVQKFGVFMNFVNNTLQMMKEMMVLRVEMMKIAKYTLQIKTKEHFAKTSSFAT